VERIDTHGALVFLGGDRALKLKRAVSFSYMDFSTVEKRRAACEAELAINRRTAPGLYRCVRAVTREAGGSLAFDGAGAPVDWLVEMRRFGQDALFDRMAEAGRLDHALAEDAGAALAALHRIAERRTDHGGLQSIRDVIAIDSAELARHGALGEARVGRWRTRSLEEIGRHAALLEERRQGGFVRRCHGDAHLRNFVLWEGRATLFDAIEFNDDFAIIDTYYDLAFLLMDLWERRHPDLANAAFNRYLTESEDLGGLPLLPLYLSARASVRAHVSLSMAAVQPDEARAQALRREAGEYLESAWSFLNPAPPVIVAIGGLSGTGKSSLARLLAPGIGAAPGAVVLRSDVIRKRLAGVPENERLPPGAYSEAANERVFAELRAKALAAAGAGQGVVVDAVHARAEERAAIEQCAKRAGVPFAGLWLEGPAEVLAERLRRRRGDASDANEPVLRLQLGYDLGVITWRRLSAAQDLEAVAAAARRLLPAAGKR
jgi:aminoglycoside phosphotransferase family enzyme